MVAVSLKKKIVPQVEGRFRGYRSCSVEVAVGTVEAASVSGATEWQCGRSIRSEEWLFTESERQAIVVGCSL